MASRTGGREGVEPRRSRFSPGAATSWVVAFREKVSGYEVTLTGPAERRHAGSGVSLPGWRATREGECSKDERRCDGAFRAQGGEIAWTRRIA
jgi:hypothetical protein